MTTKLRKTKSGGPFYFLGKTLIFIGATFFLWKTIQKHHYDYQHEVTFILWFVSISLFVFAVEEIIVDLIMLIRRKNISRHTPALLYMDALNLGFSKSALSDLSLMGIIWRVYAIILGACVSISIVLFGYIQAANRFSLGDNDSAIFSLFLVVGGLLMLAGVIFQFIRLVKNRIRKIK